MKAELARSLWKALERIFNIFDRSVSCYGRDITCITIASPGQIVITLSDPNMSEESAFGYWMGRVFNELLQDEDMRIQLLNRVHARDEETAQAGLSQTQE
jgi:hypothetical protein